ncbi:hypothetical protein PMAYCL1PPCAC_29126, partial [Pristionchus mayeri]
MRRILLLFLVFEVTIGTTDTSSARPSCGEGEVYDNCPNSCYEPVCGDNGMQLCAGIISCDPPKCVCDRSKDYARDPSTAKCVKRNMCPSWTVNPCMTVKCSSGTVCEAKNGKARCVKESTIQPSPVTLNACAVTLCMEGSVCVEEGGVARCIFPPGGNNCTLPFEEWRECASCEPSCEIRTTVCNKMCQPSRCMCRRGFFRSTEGKCVTENDCDAAAITPTPLSCYRANEEYRECSSACEPNCREKDQGKMCIAMCKPPSCQCKDGFYRAENGECVPPHQCTVRRGEERGVGWASQASSTPPCKANEQFLTCSSMCEPQCGQYQPIPCIVMCGSPKCQCRNGFYRNSNGDCVTRKVCEKSPNPSTPGHPSCKRNQIFAQCSSACIPKCGEYAVRPCMAMCGPPKCQCGQGFYLDNHGECVTREECERQSSTPKTPSQSDCQPNEIFRECSSQCEEKCGENLTRACPASCGPPKCQCDDGFLRNEEGECVLKSECVPRGPRSQADCGPNMTFTNCSSPCQAMCGDYVEKPCIERCDPPKCECNRGFYFNRVGDCVNREDCELDVPFTCANVDCRSGMVCNMTNGEPVCVNPEVLTCNTVKCAGGH